MIDDLDLSIKAYKNDGSLLEIDVTDEMVQNFETTTVGTSTVTIAYEGKSCTFTLNVSPIKLDNPQILRFKITK